MKYIALIVTIIVFTCCSSIKITQLTDYKPDNKHFSDSVFILTQYDTVAKKLKLIGQFKMIENNNGLWDKVYQKIKKFAISNNANVVKIDEYHMNGGYGTKGNLGYVVGKLYDTKNIELFMQQSKDTNYLYISRYEKDNFIQAGFSFDLFVNGIYLGKITNKSMYKVKIKVGDKIRLSTDNNKTYYDLNIDKKRDYYIAVYKHIENLTTGRSIMVSVGDVDFYEFNPIIGKLEYENIIQIK